MRLKKSQLGYIVIDGQFNEALRFNECYSYYPTKFAAEVISILGRILAGDL